MTAQFTDEDEGKRIVNADGDTIGRVIDVRAGTPYVDPDPGVTDTVKSKLGWGDADEETYALDESSIESVSDEEIRISHDI